ncbi:pseudouridine synthase [Saccharicrinis sp. FJH54]|uniref:pseudouridine synthase n=1 Tax=Saccharicrinis sp. FJH54 TaxID=3344665 RepID=UPI0035D43888
MKQNYSDRGRKGGRDGSPKKDFRKKEGQAGSPKKDFQRSEGKGGAPKRDYRKKDGDEGAPGREYKRKGGFDKPRRDAGEGGFRSRSAKKTSRSDLRLNQYIARAGICSRREADKLIEQGLVKVNGKLVTELGVRVNPSDEVRVDGTRIKPEKKVYILLNKPKDTVTTLKDPNARKTVFDLIKNACEERVYPVGRLDRNTTGVLLLTNDGDLSARLTHPKFNHKKIYHVFLNKDVTKNDLQKLADGFELEDGFIAADVVSYAHPEDKSQIGIEIHSGRNRVVRRMFEHLGYDVVKLDRVYFAGLTKKNLPRGKWRFLTEQELNMFKMLKK